MLTRRDEMPTGELVVVLGLAALAGIGWFLAMLYSQAWTKLDIRRKELVARVKWLEKQRFAWMERACAAEREMQRMDEREQEREDAGRLREEAAFEVGAEMGVVEGGG